MPSRLRVLLLLLLPALALPRGVSLAWCLCLETAAAACCTSCCEPRDQDALRLAPEPSADADCAGCLSLEIGDLELLLTGDAPVLPELAVVAHALPVREFAPAPSPRPTPLGRAPPAALTPAGLLPGTRPLRL